MTPEERERPEEICKKMATENDLTRFEQLVFELNKLLELKHQHVHSGHKGKPQGTPSFDD